LRCSLRDGHAAGRRHWHHAAVYHGAASRAAGTPFELHYYIKRQENAAFVGEMAKSSAVAAGWSIVQTKGKVRAHR
jgi:hypothetical protein